MPKKSSSHSHSTAQKPDNRQPDATEQTFPVVGVGASAGGLEAFTKLLKNLPADTGMAFVLVQHLDPKHVSLLPELLARATAMPVVEISDGTRITPNHVYVMPPNYSLAMLHGVLHLMPRPNEYGKHLPIDDFLRSLAEDRQSNAIGVILSGTASDGTLGMKAIKSEGGITFAQSEESAEYDGMPHSAIAAGHVDTPTAKSLLNLIDADVGRPIGNLRPNVSIPDLENRVREVINTMSTQSIEVQDKDGHCYTLSIRPYKTLENRIEGVVMSFINIDSTKNAERLHQILRQERRLAAVVRDSNDAVTVQDFAGCIPAWNRRAQEMRGYTEKEALELKASTLIPEKIQEETRSLIERLKRGEPVPPFETWRRTKDGREIKVWLTTSVLLDESGNPASISTTEKEV